MKTVWVYARFITTTMCLICLSCAVAAHRAGDTPQAYYDEGVTDYERKLWPEANNAFNTLKQKYPYSKYAALADLRLADVKFKAGAYLEAIEAYRLFIQSHPSHEEVPYAKFREALSNFKELSDDYFFLPPSYEKDQNQVQKAATAFKEFLDTYPDNKNATEATEKLRLCRHRLFDHDLYVARFYRRIKKYPGAIGRYEFVRHHYAEYGTEPFVLLELSETYVKSGDATKAKLVLNEIVTQHGQSKEAKVAAQMLAKLDFKKK